MGAVTNLDATYVAQGAVRGFVAKIGSLNWINVGIPSVQSATKGDTIKVTLTSAVSASGDYTNSSGYATLTDDMKGKDLTLNIHKYRNLQLTDADWAKFSGNQAALEAVGVQEGEALAYDFASASYASTVTNTNFPVSSSYTTGQFTGSAAWIDLCNMADTRHWRDDRFVVCGPTLWKELNTARASTVGSAFGSLQDQDVFGFSPEKVTMTPPNGDIGFACTPNAFTVVTVYHKPQPALLKVLGTAVQVTDPTGKFTIGYKEVLDGDKSTVKNILEVLGGAVAVDSTALIHLKA